jgi:hypothetical protein
MSTRALNLWVFRESRRKITGISAKSALLAAVSCLMERSSPDSLLAALLRAGELECGIADGDGQFSPAMEGTDRLAAALVAHGTPIDVESTKRHLERLSVPDFIEASPPEGFAYYALHPLAYASVLERVPQSGRSIAVVGIRSIGTTLSAIVVAAARARGKNADRITVRPCGHSYNRSTNFSPQQLTWIHQHLASESDFLVVDEGPGLSGSSFLSVAEALISAGVLREKISLLCSHLPAFDDLRADSAPQRARRFRWIAVSSDSWRPTANAEFIGGGDWRKSFKDPADWPASWISFERLKYLSGTDEGSKTLLKFAGLGHYREETVRREQRIAEAGFAPMPTYATEGFVSYPWLRARSMTARDLSPAVIERLAAYCAFRVAALPSDSADVATLERMAEHNLSQRGFALSLNLQLERPVIPDGRMQPHEWLLDDDGQVLKSDSGAHGDDHFFPGPTDIAWDLAGTIVEWGMSETESCYLLDCYRRASGDEVAGRIGDFVISYAGFRCAYCLMAANALQGTPEETRLNQAAARYEGRVSAFTHQLI